MLPAMLLSLLLEYSKTLLMIAGEKQQAWGMDVTIRHTEASLQRSAIARFQRANKDLQEHRRASIFKGLLAGVLLVLLLAGVVAGAQLLF